MTMGSCLAKCLPIFKSNKLFKKFNLLSRTNNQGDFTQLVEEKPVLELVDDLVNSNSVAYTRLNEPKRLPSTGSCISEDIQLQSLDAGALLLQTATSTPESTLDLEWEHETLPVSFIQETSKSFWTSFPEEVTSCLNDLRTHQMGTSACNSGSDWSRVSSANSLEWDSVPNTFEGSPPAWDFDTDTQLLLSEIERLTNQTLQETGKDLGS